MTTKKNKRSLQNMKDQYLDIIMDDLETHPHCPHGPTLLFKQMKEGKERRFYACAACRDRKLCRFFHWADEDYSESKRRIWEQEKLKLMPEETPKELYKRFCIVRKKVSAGKRAGYCHSCAKLLLSNEMEAHEGHDIIISLTLHQLLHPSEMFKPLETNTKEAQYLFSTAATEMIINAAKTNNIKHILCMGTPRVHEFIQAESRGGMTSLLLDIDGRFQNFYEPERFCWFNAFNRHFFLGHSSEIVLTKFLQLDEGEDMMIVMDPPFGGRIEPLAHTIRYIQLLHRQLNTHLQQNIRVMFISPYFMEHHIVASFPAFQMLDYKVAYDNHPLFSQGAKARKLGSPIRIFTDIPPQCVPLPPEEGYWFCKPCKRWASEENRHCVDCMKCTSKNGCTYVHCFKCQKCVKPSWKHCNKCQRCCLVPHQCGSFEPSGVCYKCGRSGHKKYDCPETEGNTEVIVKKKQKLGEQPKLTKKKKKRSGVQSIVD